MSANALIDLNRDHNVDWLHERPGVAFKFGDGKENFKPGGHLEVTPTRNEINMHPADFNGDGFIDLAVHWGRYGNFTNMIKAWNVEDKSAASVDDGLCFGDLDGDGALDITGYTGSLDGLEFYPSGKIVKREVKANSTILVSETE